ncbi:VOC family protein [Salinispora pacifica]|uniref:VOC family protein n=1 Tax=Salinispora pacifica TaxID=351187 RepID=UPI00035FFCE8|nr:VOC family protein [Salinispora pacifica]
MRGRITDDSATPRAERRDYWGVVLDAPEAAMLARFYTELLGWQVYQEEPDFVSIAAPDGVAYLAVQTAAGYQRPTWPTTSDAPQMMLHLDFEVSDLGAAVAHAVELGATVADHQPQQRVRVLFDPAGHPFCLYLGR